MNNSNYRDTVAESMPLAKALKDEKYTIDYYQREYAWDEEQVRDLIYDLTSKFKEDYKEDHTTENTKFYKQYFLGSLLVANVDGAAERIIDGQQRLSTLTLLFLWIYKNVNIPEAMNYVFSAQYGEEKTFNLDIEERHFIMEKLLSDSDLSVEKNDSKLIKNYNILDNLLSSYDEHFLKSFYYWISNRVYLVKIKTYDDAEAYTLFETMNDRGKPLTKVDMLKGYLLAHIDTHNRNMALRRWQEVSKKFKTDEDFTTFLIDLFRSKWAVNSPQDVAGENDWSSIGNKIHSWIAINKNNAQVKLNKSSHIIQFIEDLDWYAEHYLYLIDLEQRYVKDARHVCYNYNRKVLYQKILILGLISPQDDSKTVDSKIKLLSEFLSIRTALSGWNGQNIRNESNAIKYIVGLLRRVRVHKADKDLDILVWFLTTELSRKEEKDKFVISEKTVTYKKNESILQGILAVILDNLPNSNNIQAYTTYVKYDVEHLLANKYEINDNLAFTSEESYSLRRDSIGALALLAPKENSSFKDAKYTDKLGTYANLNLTVSLLSPEIYMKDNNNQLRLKTNPEFNQFMKDNPQLIVKPYPLFHESSIKERETFYVELAKIIWDKKNLENYMDNKTAASLEELVNEYGDVLSYEPEPDNEIKTNKNENKNFKAGTVIFISHKKFNVETRIEATVVNSNKIVVTEISNAPRYEKYTPTGKKTFQDWSGFYKKMLNESYLHSGDFFSWKGSSEPMSLSTATALIYGYRVASSNWNEKD